MSKLDKCPVCGGELGDCWAYERKLVRHCHNEDCEWEGEPRTPEQKDIVTTKLITVGRPFSYQIFDRFGHPMVHSASYNTFEEAEENLKKELECGKNDKHAGPFTGIMWPAQVEVRAKVYK